MIGPRARRGKHGRRRRAAIVDYVRRVKTSLRFGERRPLGLGGSVQDVREPAGSAAFADCPLPPPLAAILARRGVERLYAHQAETIEAVRAGRSVILSAPTASGKTEAYLVPAAEAALQGRRALLLFPTKALARDQLARFAELEALGLRAAVYDGDTPEKERRRIREALPHFLLTNPDMLHLMLLGSRSFRELWATLGLLVLDDVHVYTGAFGGHVAQILKRLRRMCAVRGSRLQVVACSATLHDPAEFALALLSQRLKVVRGDARRSPVLHRIVNPPYVAPDRRESHLTRTLRIVEELLGERRKLLVFANAHVSAEALAVMAAEHGLDGVAVYRAGLLDAERRALEARFRDGDLRALVTTSALELGIDVGAVDAVVLAGYPGSATRVRQRIGRAGRMDLPRRAGAGVAFADGLHAVEHTAIHMLPAITGADPAETGGLSAPSGRMFVYDGFPGGSGIARVAYERLEEVLAKALDRLAHCPCERGCPGCILDPQCGNANEHLDRAAGRELLERLLGVHPELPGLGAPPPGPGA